MRRFVYVPLVVVPLLIVVVAALFVTTRGPRSDDATSREYEASTTILESPEHGPELCLGGVADSLPPQCGGVPVTNWNWAAVDGEESRGGTTWTSAYVRGTYDGERFTLTQEPGAPRPPENDDPQRFAPLCDDPEVVDAGDRGNEWQETSFGDIPGLAAVWVSDPGHKGDPDAFVGNVVVRPGYGDEARAYIRERWGGKLCLVERDQPSAKELDADFARLDDVLTAEFLTAWVDNQRGVIRADLVIVDERSQREVDEAFGEGRVELTGALRPVD